MTLLNERFLTQEELSLLFKDAYEYLEVPEAQSLRAVHIIAFFLNRQLLMEETKTKNLTAAIYAKVKKDWPGDRKVLKSKILTRFLYGGSAALISNNVMHCYLARYDDRLSLTEYVHEVSGVPTHLLTLSKGEKSCGISNLNIIQRLAYAATSSVVSPHRADLQRIVHYLSRQQGEDLFISRGGDRRNVDVLRSATIVGAFTREESPLAYLSGQHPAYNSGKVVERAYSHIKADLLLLNTEGVSAPRGHDACKVLTWDRFVDGMHMLYDQYTNDLSVRDEHYLATLHQMVFGKEPSEGAWVGSGIFDLSDNKVERLTRSLIVHSTIKALEDLIGPHLWRYMPQRTLRAVQSFEHTVTPVLN